MAKLSKNQTIWIATLAGLAIFAMLELAGTILTDGVIVYPLDDPYIHLAMAEQMVAGGYGVNPGEFASADSSILFPVLLMPFVGTGFHAYLPLLYNALGLGLSLMFLAKLVLESGLAERPRIVLLFLLAAPIALNFQGLALLGMEHALHLATVLMALLGLTRWLKSGGLNGLLVLAILLGPLLRYEALGLSLVLSLAIFLSGHKKAGAGLAFGAVLPLVAFGFWLKSLGLSALPNSVLAKASFVGPDENAMWVLVSHNFGAHGNLPYALSFVMAAVGLFAMAVWKWPDRRIRILALTAAAVALGHAMLGKFGWSNRYEIYALTYVSLSVLVLLSHARFFSLGLGGALLAGFALYGHFLLLNAVNGPANIYNQQWQMGRLARAWDGPVLAGDIGLVSYGNPNKVVDLYGLASTQALAARRGPAPAGWPNQMAEAESAGMAMVYDGWLAKHLLPGWTRVAFLDLRVPVTILSTRVSIYATSPEMVAPVRALLEPFSNTLPRYAILEMTGDDTPETKEGR